MKCKCGRRAVYWRKYEGTHLCRQCFVKSVESKAKRTIRKHHMISPGDRIAVALSGGKDSSSVLYILNNIIKPRKDIEIFAIMIDEGSGNYRKRTLAIAKRLCDKLGIEYHIFSFKGEFGKTIAEKMKHIKDSKIKEPCTYCGVARRYLINKAGRELGATKIALGHNLDDEVQAALMNYIRGDMARAARMAAVTDSSLSKKHGRLFIPRIKPLREIPERETALYAYLRDFEIYEGRCRFAGGVRFDTKDFINKIEDKYPGIKFSILETFDKLNPFMRKLAENLGGLKRCRICGEPSAREICKACELWRK
jgi:uncharacterized protein (TIGR00269 family)